MSYIYSQALVEEFSQVNCSDTDALPQSNWTPIAKPCLWHDKMMEPSRLSRFGMMCKPSTDAHTEAMWTWLQEASRAKILASRGGGTGLDGQRSGMWHHMARIIGEVRPRFAYIENSPALVTRGLDRVLSDLAALGFDARWTVLGGQHTGAAHRRERIWILANSEGKRGDARHLLESSENWRTSAPDRGFPRLVKPQSWWPSSFGANSESGLPGLADGVANRAHRLKASGNGQIPAVAATAFNLLKAQI